MFLRFLRASCIHFIHHQHWLWIKMPIRRRRVEPSRVNSIRVNLSIAFTSSAARLREPVCWKGMAKEKCRQQLEQRQSEHNSNEFSLVGSSLIRADSFRSRESMNSPPPSFYDHAHSFYKVARAPPRLRAAPDSPAQQHGYKSCERLT